MRRHHWNGILLVLPLSFLLAAVFLSGIAPRELRGRLAAQIGAVGLSVGVAPNPDSAAAEQLRTKEEELRRKEQVLDQKAAYLTERSLQAEANSMEYSFLGGTLLIALLLLNFYFDHLALKESRPAPAA